MKKISKIKISLIFLAIIVILFGIFTFTNYKNENTEYIHPTLKGTPQEGNLIQNKNIEKNDKKIDTEKLENKGEVNENINNSDVKSEQITLIAGDLNIKLDFKEGQTFYEVLMAEQEKGKFTFNGKNYTGLGFFVTDIGDLHEGDGKNLLYYINGKEASSGVSVYIPKNGDLVEWKLE